MNPNDLLDEALVAYQNDNSRHAIQILLNLTQLDPVNYDALHALAVIYASQGEHNLAISFYSKALELNSSDPYLLSNYGSSFLELNQNSKALELLKKAVDLEPHFYEFLYNLANCYCALGVPLTAVSLYKKVIELQPTHHQSFNNLGKALFDLNQFDDAATYFYKALEFFSDSPNYLMNYGNTLNKLNQFYKALFYFDKAIALNPDMSDVWLNRGISFLGIGLIENAIENFDRAIALNPYYVKALLNKASALQDLKNYYDAVFYYEKARDLDPNTDWALGNLVFSKMKMCDWRNFNNYISTISNLIRSNMNAVHPFAYLAMVDNPDLQLQCSKRYSNFNYSSISRSFSQPQYKNSKLRVGYYSADFNNHAVSFLTAELYELHDRNLFEIYAFSYKGSDGSPIRARLEKAFDHFIDASSMSDSEIASSSRDFYIDIAVDLGGFTAGSRPGVFANRIAPIQISYIGYLGTMGSPFIDYLIADKFIIPSECQSSYSEKIIYLPSYQVNDRKRSIGNNCLSRVLYGLPDDAFVYCCFNDTYKISPFIFDSWMRILHAVPKGVLFLNKDNKWVVDNLRNEAQLRGICSSRLIFSPRVSVDDYLARYRTCDLFLDTTPYNAGTTASDALWMGLPVLTLSGHSFASRVAASLLSAIGLPELIANTQEQYQELAIELAMNPKKLAEIKLRLANNRSTAPLFNTPLFTTNLEAAYIKMYESYRSGAPLDHIYI